MRLDDDNDTVTNPPSWACEEWGQYEHDWLDCPECVSAYEKWLEEQRI